MLLFELCLKHCPLLTFCVPTRRTTSSRQPRTPARKRWSSSAWPTRAGWRASSAPSWSCSASAQRLEGDRPLNWLFNLQFWRSCRHPEFLKQESHHRSCVDARRALGLRETSHRRFVCGRCWRLKYLFSCSVRLKVPLDFKDCTERWTVVKCETVMGFSLTVRDHLVRTTNENFRKLINTRELSVSMNW